MIWPHSTLQALHAHCTKNLHWSNELRIWIFNPNTLEGLKAKEIYCQFEIGFLYLPSRFDPTKGNDRIYLNADKSISLVDSGWPLVGFLGFKMTDLDIFFQGRVGDWVKIKVSKREGESGLKEKREMIFKGIIKSWAFRWIINHVFASPPTKQCDESSLSRFPFEISEI